MFYPTENSTLLEVPDNAFGFVYKCWIPEYGYGINVISGAKEKTDIIKRSEDIQEQFWERQTLPHDYHPKRKKEHERQKIDRNWFDPYLEQIRRREWGRRLRGVWFWNNGKPVYLTGLHYFMLNYWPFQGKWLDYRRPDRDSMYITMYCIQDPNCLGLNEIMNRKSGKTLRAGCVLYERTSRINNHHGGIQSKTDTDAWEVFKKAVVHPWKKLPHFFRPTYDLMKGDDPNDELRFFATSRRGQQAESEVEEEALESWVDFKSSEESAYDGPELHTYVSDETSKTKKDVSIIERQNVTRFCTEIGGEFKGFHYYTTTVEIEEGEEDNHEFQAMTAKSNPLVRDENGRTLTGLYTYFRPAYMSLFFDKYGEPDEVRARTYLSNARKKLQEEGDLRGLSSLKRKQPMTFNEAFSIDGKFSLYNPELINMQLDDISWGSSVTEFGDLVWKDGYEFERPVVKPNGDIDYILNEVEWKPNPNGRFEKVLGWTPKDSNKVYKNGNKYLPNNSFAIRIGCDPFRYDKTKDKRRSNCAAFAYQMQDELYPDDEFNNTFVLRYAYRAESTRLSNADIIKMAWWCGCQVLFERNVNHWKRDFQDWNCDGFYMFMPGEQEPGVATDGRGNVVQTICNYTEAHINEHIKKVKFKSLLKDWLSFKIEDTEKHDEGMAAGMTLIAVKGRKFVRPGSNVKNIESILPYNKAI